MRPLLIDLFCGSFGWSAGWLELGGRVVGFDLDHQDYHGPVPQGADLVLQDVSTLDGAQFHGASLILASPPCQTFSYMAMPWSRAKAMISEYEASADKRAELTALFDACFRIQREASAAAGKKIPMVVENVRGAQRWVGRARYHYGSYFLFGDVPALMPITLGRGVMKAGVAHRSNGETNFHGSAARAEATKNAGGSWFNVAHNTTSGKGQNPDGRGVKVPGLANGHFPPGGLAQGHIDGVKSPGGGAEGWFGSQPSPMRRHSSKSSARKAASARIAKIPEALSRHIARVYFPRLA